MSSRMVWTKPGIVAVNSGSTSIHLWNLDNGDNSTLNLPTGSNQAEHYTATSYCSSKGSFIFFIRIIFVIEIYSCIAM